MFFDRLPLDAPVVVGGTGGSGTRVLAQILLGAGFRLGRLKRPSLDTVTFLRFQARWIPRIYPAAAAASPDKLNWFDRQRMQLEWNGCFARHAAHVLWQRPARSADEHDHEQAGWGWKNPRSIYLLPFLHDRFPRMKYIHVIRDGRDMAFSSNQQQLEAFGDYVLGPGGQPEFIRSIELWDIVNSRAADFGRDVLKERYLRVRYEDVCQHPEIHVPRILEFVGCERAAAGPLCESVKAPSSIGRWQSAPTSDQAAIAKVAVESLGRFGYLSRTDRSAA